MAFAQLHRDQPLGDINTTPLIDVMLVLLVVLAITLPPKTNTLEYPLPRPGAVPKEVKPVRNLLTIGADDSVSWNGDKVTGGELVATLREASWQAPEPQLEFAPEPEASYSLSADVLNVVKASGVTNVGFVGNEQYRTFGRHD
ncbi:biopolymer transporter ExbD [Altererythrobacter salegens]|uniref:Biopolymer transporter ExbD n=1 Tax=Croceibacterium salegens TaxID=1737568 RepID=A0A6I4SYT3_9SPHN|nr:biopolymer transporter ExbD [Croceibacterium salegens]MXO60340.1 biopolymer transporter ExbD [Croceibacterium salegens]